MTENINARSISPMETFAIATRDVSDLSHDDVIEKYDRVTFLRFTTKDGVVKTFNFAHMHLID